MLLMVDIKQARQVYSVARNFLRIGDFFYLRKLLFAIRTHWFFALWINFFDFQKVPVPSLIAEDSHDEAKMRGKMSDLC